MSDEAAPAAPKKKGGKGKIILAAVLSIAAGGALPVFVNVPALMGKTTDAEAGDGHAADHGKTAKKKKAHAEEKTAPVPFGDVTVNLAEERMTRYLRVKIVLIVEEEAESTVHTMLEKKKAVMKGWLIGHLAGKTVKDVQGTVGYNRSKREVLERFEDILYPNGHGALKDVEFEEYLIQ